MAPPLPGGWSPVGVTSHTTAFDPFPKLPLQRICDAPWRERGRGRTFGPKWHLRAGAGSADTGHGRQVLVSMHIRSLARSRGLLTSGWEFETTGRCEHTASDELPQETSYEECSARGVSGLNSNDDPQWFPLGKPLFSWATKNSPIMTAAALVLGECTQRSVSELDPFSEPAG